MLNYDVIALCAGVSLVVLLSVGRSLQNCNLAIHEIQAVLADLR